MSEKILVRFATNEDFEDVLEISQGIYDGWDYLPKKFHNWLHMPNKLMFVAELEGKPIGVQVTEIADGGQTAILQAFRINSKYRSRGYSYLITSAILKQVQRKYPHLCKVRFTSWYGNKQMMAFANRKGFNKIMEMNFVEIEINELLFKTFTAKNNQEIDLQELDKNALVGFMLSGRNPGIVIPNEILVVNWVPYQVMQSNVDLMFEEGDIMLSDVSEEEIQQGKMPNSFSHGRMVNCTDIQYWHCAIYAEEDCAFKAHLMQQMTLGFRRREQGKLQFPRHFEFLFPQSPTFDRIKIIREEFGHNTVVEADNMLLFERPIKSLIRSCTTK